jgi:hypothetical protein
MHDVLFLRWKQSVLQSDGKKLDNAFDGAHLMGANVILVKNLVSKWMSLKQNIWWYRQEKYAEIE